MTTLVIATAVLGAGALGVRYALRVARNPKMKGIFGSAANAATGGKAFVEGTFLSEMSAKEAAQILNVAEKATEPEIKAAHRKLMQINHPDNGGSTYIAGKINEAKEMLVGKGYRKE